MKSDIYKVMDVDTGEEYILHDKDLHEQADRQSADTSAAVSMVEQETARAKQAETDLRSEMSRVAGDAQHAADEAKASAQGAKESADQVSGYVDKISAAQSAAEASALQAYNDADVCKHYAEYVQPHFVYSNNRLYLRDTSYTTFIVYNNRLLFKSYGGTT